MRWLELVDFPPWTWLLGITLLENWIIPRRLLVPLLTLLSGNMPLWPCSTVLPDLSEVDAANSKWPVVPFTAALPGWYFHFSLYPKVTSGEVGCGALAWRGCSFFQQIVLFFGLSILISKSPQTPAWSLSSWPTPAPFCLLCPLVVFVVYYSWLQLCTSRPVSSPKGYVASTECSVCCLVPISTS